VSSERPDLVFIHGMYLNGHSWQPWIDRFEARGFSTHAPSWPFHDGRPAELRATIDPGLGRLMFGDVVARMKKFVDTLPERPILIGHSIGGLVVQKLVNDGYARAAVAISSAPPQGFFSFDRHFLPANFPHVNPFAGNAPVIMTKARFHYTFCNTMTRADSDAAFEEYVVPESRNVPRSTLTSQAAINLAAPHVPLLFLAGDTDHLTPMSLVEKNVRAYKNPDSTVDFTAFGNRSHFICNQEGWEEVADFAADWLEWAHPENA
jgi:pimeloyl-ACP methyl ester carboxylesterase